jgi:hypothetical protein
MINYFTGVWNWLWSEPKVRMRDLSALERSYLFALLGTSREDREWAQSEKLD